MPGSEIEYCDIGLSDWYKSLEDPEDRVEYEDPDIERRQLSQSQILGTEARLEKPFSTEIVVVAELAPAILAAPASVFTVTFRDTAAMESIQKYSGVGGGTTWS